MHEWEPTVTVLKHATDESALSTIENITVESDGRQQRGKFVQRRDQAGCS